MNKNITLIGMSQSGKSILGKLLAKAWKYDFFDGDEIIEKEQDKTILEILSQDGEEKFMVIEEKVLLNFNGKKKIFSPGGSCIYSPKGMAHLMDNSIIVYLDIPFEIIKKRIESKKTQNLLVLKGMTLKQLYNSRKILYKKCAHLTVKLDDRPIKENVKILINKINEFKIESKS